MKRLISILLCCAVVLAISTVAFAQTVNSNAPISFNQTGYGILEENIETTAISIRPSLTSSDVLRDQIARNWGFMQQGLYDNNCLAWAVGMTNIWLWPWGEENPTVQEVDEFMAEIGYNASDANMSCDIYAYGTSNAVTHFARGRGDGPLAVPIDAKWGHYEIFTHTSTNPYYTIEQGGVYGLLVRSYYM